MRTGTDAARCGQVLLAESLYLEALALASNLLDPATACDEPADDRVAAFVVTHLNLADLHAQEQHTATAAAYLCTAHRALMSLLGGAGIDPSLQRAALRHSRETHAALLEHLELHGDAEAVLAALRAGCMPFITCPPRRGTTLH